MAAVAGTGVEALRIAATTAVDLVLLDVHLPDMSGLDVLRRLRTAGHTADVIMVTRARDLAVVQAAVAHALESADGGLTAHEAGTALGASRVTARRYLEYLVETGLGVRRARYGTAGRPQTGYRWRAGGISGP